jgi:dTDP-glucose 4,6-dehydratase
MSRILVTGACGFIGSSFVRMLGDHKVTIVDKLTYAGSMENIQGVDAQFIEGDICSIRHMNGVFKDGNFDVVVNFAAESHVDRSIDGPTVFAHTNFMGTQALLEMCRRFDVGRFVQISTDEVYGDLGVWGFPATEESILKPSSPYSASKASADLLALSYVRTYGLDVVVTRCSNNYGPRQHPEKFIPRMITTAKAGKPVPVYGDGKNVRDWIHVTDHCRGILAAMERGKSGEVYNFGGFCEKENLEVVSMILELCGCPNDQVEYVKDRPGHDMRYSINFAKAIRELEWNPEIEFEDGLKETVELYE